MLESPFNNVAGFQVSNFINKRLQHRCFPKNILKSLRTPILKNICKRLFLEQLPFGYWLLKMCYLREHLEEIKKLLYGAIKSH